METPLTEKEALAEWEVATIEVFVRAANLIGLPRSIGEIYGVLFCASEPITFDAVEVRLEISRGSISQGLKVLRQIGAVKVVYVAGSRKDHYKPELSMRRLISGFIKDQFNPHITSGQDRLNQITDLIDQSLSGDALLHARQRLQTLHTWHARTQKLFPVAIAVLGGSPFDDGVETNKRPVV